MRPIFDYDLEEVEAQGKWDPNYPNPPDLKFNYHKLLTLTKEGGNIHSIGTAPGGGKPPKVAVIGAGVAGLTAARELARCHYSVTLIEGTDRICGRQYTKVRDKGDLTGMELGAMRFPFFGDPGQGNCILDYYLKTEAGFDTMDFPNPGSAPGNTGIYMNQGYGPDNNFEKPQFVDWKTSMKAPDHPSLKAVYTKVVAFVNLFTSTVSKLYITPEWSSTVWPRIANNYEQMSIGDLVSLPAVTQYKDDGWFGGFGMSIQEAKLFAVIGSGDGSWGAFYQVGAMWYIRCVMFGFNSKLQAVIGASPDKAPTLPHYNSPVKDSNGASLTPPLYKGIQSLGEWLFYAVPPGSAHSFYGLTITADTKENYKIFTRTAVEKITKLSDGFRIEGSVTDSSGNKKQIDPISCQYVVMTPTLWSSQVSIALEGFDKNQHTPPEFYAARNLQHNITSCKAFFPLKEIYWETGNSKIPQIIVSDDLTQDSYGIKWGAGSAVLLVSYTWEDDAVKLLPEEGNDLAALLLGKLDKITEVTTGEKISDYVDQTNGATTIHWARQPFYRGCAKLYRQRNWDLNYTLLTYNAMRSASSGLYLAGENYGVEGGWTEPALRLAVDAVIHILKNSGGTFIAGFDPDNDYPKYNTDFVPNNVYPTRAACPQ